MAEKKKLGQLLKSQLDKDFVVWRLPHSARTLILKDITNDLQVGFKIDKGKLRGAWVEVVDIGVRIPSVEEFYDRYEIHAMREMGFRNPEPSGWLTFWRPTYSSLELEERGLKVDAIQQDFAQFYEPIAVDPEGFRSETLDLLSRALRPGWATQPGSTFLITKALVAKTLRNPDSDACANVDVLIKNEPVIEGYMAGIENFCVWLRTVNDKDGSTLSKLP